MRHRNVDHSVRNIALQQAMPYFAPMDRLRELVDQLDRLHASAWLDVRHRDLFKNHALYVWPWLSPAIRELMRRGSNN